MKLENNSYTRYGIALAVVSVLLFAQALGVFATVSSSTVATYNQWGGLKACTYVVFTDGTTTYAQNCNTGTIDYSGTTTASIIQSAVNSGGLILIKCGTYTISSAITLVSNLTLTGENGCSVIRLANGANSYILQYVTNATLSNVAITHLVLDGNGANQNAAGANRIIEIDPDHIDNLLIAHNVLKDAYGHGIKLQESCGSLTCRLNKAKIIEDNYIDDHGIGQTGYGIYIDYAPNTLVKGNFVKNTGSIMDAIEMGNLGMIYTVENYVSNGNINFPFSHNSIISNNFVDEGSIINDGNTAHNVTITGNIVRESTPSDAYAAIRTVGNGGTITDNRIHVTAETGIRSQGNNTIVVNNYVTASSTAEIGIWVGAAHENIISNNYVNNFAIGIQLTRSDNIVTANIVSQATTGIYFVDSSSSGHTMLRNQVYGNNLQGAATTPIDFQNQNSATNKVFNNINFVTEAEGTATISSANTNVNVTHSLGYTPSAAEITWTFTEDPTTSVGVCWVEGISSTQFRIKCEAAPGASNLDLSWSVRRI